MDFLQGRDHREHDPHLAPLGLGKGGSPQDRPQLGQKQFRVLERQADAPPAHERIRFLVMMAQIRDGLVATNIERADRDLIVGRGRDDRAIGLQLFLFVRHVRVRQVQVFGAEQTDPRSSHGLGRLHVGHAVDVRQELEFHTVGCPGRLIAVGGQLVLEMEELAFQLAIRRAGLRIRVDRHVPVASVDDDGVARVDLPQDSAHARDGRNAATAGQNRRVTRLTAGLRDDAL